MSQLTLKSDKVEKPKSFFRVSYNDIFEIVSPIYDNEFAEKYTTKAFELLKRVKLKTPLKFVGKSRKSILAGTIYITQFFFEIDRLTQKKVGDMAGVTDVTVRRISMSIDEVLELNLHKKYSVKTYTHAKDVQIYPPNGFMEWKRGDLGDTAGILVSIAIAGVLGVIWAANVHPCIFLEEANKDIMDEKILQENMKFWSKK